MGATQFRGMEQNGNKFYQKAEGINQAGWGMGISFLISLWFLRTWLKNLRC
jgi:hypothetical protein